MISLHEMADMALGLAAGLPFHMYQGSGSDQFGFYKPNGICLQCQPCVLGGTKSYFLGQG